MTLEEEISTLKLKKAKQFLEIESMATVDDSLYIRFGKTVSAIMLKEKKLRREIENNLYEN